MIQCASSSSSMSTSVRRFPSNARVSCSARPKSSRPAATSSGLNLSSSNTVTAIVVSSQRSLRAAHREHTVKPTVDPLGEIGRLRNLVGGREQVGKPLFGRHHFVVQRDWQPPHPALRELGNGEVHTHGGSVLSGPFRRIVPCPL